MGKEELLKEAYNRHYEENDGTTEDQYECVVRLIESEDIKTAEELDTYM